MKKIFSTILILLFVSFSLGFGSYVYAQNSQNGGLKEAPVVFSIDGVKAFFGAIVDITKKYIIKPFITDLIRPVEKTPKLISRNTYDDESIVENIKDLGPFKVKPPIRGGTNDPFSKVISEDSTKDLYVAKQDQPLVLSPEEKSELVDAPNNQNNTQPEFGSPEYWRIYNDSVNNPCKGKTTLGCRFTNWLDDLIGKKKEVEPPTIDDELRDAPKEEEKKCIPSTTSKFVYCKFGGNLKSVTVEKADCSVLSYTTGACNPDPKDPKKPITEDPDELSEEEKEELRDGLNEKEIEDEFIDQEDKEFDEFLKEITLEEVDEAEESVFEEESSGYESCEVLVKFDTCWTKCGSDAASRTSTCTIKDWECHSENINFLNSCYSDCGAHPGFCTK